MTNIAERQRQARCTDRLRNAERELSEALIELNTALERSDLRTRAIRNALVATRYALKPSRATLAAVRDETTVIE